MGSVTWNTYQNHVETIAKATTEARAIFYHNLAYRKWNTSHGGVYAKITPQNQPNQFLDVANREIESTEGDRFTLINPFHMTKAAYALIAAESDYPILNKTISLDPINPDNIPDAYEEKALWEFEEGALEVSGVTSIKGRPYMRLLRPYITVQGCRLKCHNDYEVDDIRGAMSIAVPMAQYQASEKKTRNTIILTHLLLWCIGTVSIFFFSRHTILKQRQLSESESKFRILAEFANDWEYWLAEDGSITFMSPSCAQITGYTVREFQENPALLHDTIHPAYRELYQDYQAEAADNNFRELEIRIITKQGEHKWLSHTCSPIIINGEPMGVRVSNRDITARKSLEDQLLQSQKLESLGLLAGSTAHDFNNMLTAITGYTSLIQRLYADKDEQLKGFLNNIRNATKKAENLTGNLLAFSRKQIRNPSHIDINELIRNLSQLLRRLISEDIDLIVTCPDAEYLIYADVNQVEQVMINLATNARDAMQYGGILTITTDLVAIDQETALSHEVTPGNFVKILVSDTGSGIDPEHLAQIFDPFFTTKEKGKGTGLGLSTIYGIVKQQEGFITVESTPGKGTTFAIHISQSLGKKDLVLEPSAPETGLDSGQKGATILVAEDEENVRAFVADTLRVHGHTPIIANDGEEALELFRQHKGEIDLVILDLIMPKQHGLKVFETMCQETSHLEAIFMSGYPKDILSSKGVVQEDLEFLAKPLTVDELMKKVNQLLQKRT